ncbi:MAG: META domain-containing protein [Nocardioidaceae bacterium]|nr:META domain-containing protein [Nocardioidaceae bacterium]
MRIARTTLLPTLLLLAALAGCGNNGHTDGGLQPVAAGPTTYVVTGVTVKGQRRELVPGTEIRLRFEDSRLTLTAGCNTMSGTYDLDGSRLTVAALGMTEMGCDRARMDQDTWLGGLFARPVQFTPGPDGAVISGDTVLALADREDVSPDRPLVGTKWLLDTRYDADAASSVPDGTVVVFGADGTLAYDGGSGRYRIEGDRIVIEGVEGGPLREIAGPAAYEIEERSLTITAGGKGLGFRADR